MGRRILRRPIWGYTVCLYPIKRLPGLSTGNGCSYNSYSEDHDAISDLGLCDYHAAYLFVIQMITLLHCLWEQKRKYYILIFYNMNFSLMFHFTVRNKTTTHKINLLIALFLSKQTDQFQIAC